MYFHSTQYTQGLGERPKTSQIAIYEHVNNDI